MFNIIKDIYSSSLRNKLGFKGGTMAYFFYGLDRFSVDLDFDLLVSEIGSTPSIMRSILMKYGEIKDESNKHFTYFFLLSYEKGEKAIKVEISKRYPPESSYLTANFYGTDVKIVMIKDSFATKLLACATRKRTAYRDFYDVLFYLKKGVVPNEEIIKKVIKKDTKSYLLSLRKFIMKNVTNRKVMQGIGELIDEKQKDWIRKNFKKELLARLQFYIENN